MNYNYTRKLLRWRTIFNYLFEIKMGSPKPFRLIRLENSVQNVKV